MSVIHEDNIPVTQLTHESRIANGEPTMPLE